MADFGVAAVVVASGGNNGRRGQWRQQRSRCRMIEWFGESLIVMASRGCVGFIESHQGCFASILSATQHLHLPYCDVVFRVVFGECCRVPLNM